MQEVPPSDKIVSLICRLGGFLHYSQARNELNTFINKIPVIKQLWIYNKITKKQNIRNRHIDIRLTEEEYKMVVEKAAECGLTLQ